MIAIRAEDKNRWEARAPLTPDHVRTLVSRGVEVAVEPSSLRVFPDDEYAAAGARLARAFAERPVVLGIKEVPVEKILDRATYALFSHVIKGQSANMPMLRRLMERGCSLIDWERVADDEGRRLLFFGLQAGQAGMIDVLWALGRRWAERGVPTPFASVGRTLDHEGLDRALEVVARSGEQIRKRGLPSGLRPVVFGVAGYGNTARGAGQVLAALRPARIEPGDLPALLARGRDDGRRVYVVTFREEDTVEPREAGERFDLDDFRRNPGRYRSRFAAVWPELTVLMSCVYWEPGLPRLVRREDLARVWAGPEPPRLEVVGDVSCDLEGAIECTVQVTTPDAPVYVFEPATARVVPGVVGNGPAILAVDNLPCELPREASAAFGDALVDRIPALDRCDWRAPLDRLPLPAELRRALILHEGRLTPEYAHLTRFVDGAASALP